MTTKTSDHSPCNCLRKIYDELIQTKKEVDVDFVAIAKWDRGEDELPSHYQTITMKYVHKVRRSRQKCHFLFAYCPFCGAKGRPILRSADEEKGTG